MSGFDVGRDAYVRDMFNQNLGLFMEVEDIGMDTWKVGFWDEDISPDVEIGISPITMGASINESENVLNVQICSELIAQQGNFLDEAEFRAYCTYLLVHVMLHQVFYWIEDEQEQEDTVISTLHDIMPWQYVHVARAVRDANGPF